MDPLQRQGLIKRPRAGSSPSRQILHCFSSAAGAPVLVVPVSDMSGITRGWTCPNRQGTKKVTNHQDGTY